MTIDEAKKLNRIIEEIVLPDVGKLQEFAGALSMKFPELIGHTGQPIKTRWVLQHSDTEEDGITPLANRIYKIGLTSK